MSSMRLNASHGPGRVETGELGIDSSNLVESSLLQVCSKYSHGSKAELITIPSTRVTLHFLEKNDQMFVHLELFGS